MELQLRTPAKKFAVAALLVFAAAGYCALAAIQALANHAAGVPDEKHLTLATRLDPGNAEYQYRLGRYQLIAKQSPQSALPAFEDAARLDSGRANYWLDLAITHQLLGNFDQERDALKRARVADPHTSDVAWQAANLYLAQGSLEDALREYRVVMENDPSLSQQAIQICWKIQPDIDSLLANVVPAGVDESFLEILLSRKETEAAGKVWERMVSLQQPVERNKLFAYIRYLIANRQSSQAALVWQQAATLAGLASYQPSSENLLINGDFSQEILNGGFDWLHEKVAGVTLALDPNESHSSARSLRMIFDGPGIADAGMRQVVAVEPDTTYQFSGFYKAAEMDGAGGLKFAIQDLYHETPLFMSEDLRDADFWKETGGTFTTGADTRLVMVRIARIPAGSPVRGKLWIDGLKLVRSEVHTASAAKDVQ